MKDDILGDLKNFIVSFNVPENTIEKDLDIFDESIIDSMQAIDYLIMIEEKYNINITMQIVKDKKLGKLSDMAKYIQYRLK